MLVIWRTPGDKQDDALMPPYPTGNKGRDKLARLNRLAALFRHNAHLLTGRSKRQASDVEEKDYFARGNDVARGARHRACCNFFTHKSEI